MQAAMMVPDEDVESPLEPQKGSKDAASSAVKKVDGRSLQATGRTHQFATRIKAETHQKMYEIVQREKEGGNARFTLAELIELAVDAYEREHEREG